MKKISEAFKKFLDENAVEDVRQEQAKPQREIDHQGSNFFTYRAGEIEVKQVGRNQR
jgi:hypothetical protein